MLGNTVAMLVAMVGVAEAAPQVGVLADVGVPDGAIVSVAVHPVRMLRMAAGVGSNYAGHGVRGGIAFVPFAGTVTPTLSVDYGRYFEADANPLARTLTGDPDFQSAWLDRVGYDYANAQLGLEMGSKRFKFFLHAGMSRVTSDLHMPTDANATVTFSEPPRVTMWVPSARLGFAFYLVK